MGRAKPGVDRRGQRLGSRNDRRERLATSHVSVVDGDGDAVSMTTTIEDQFGARLMVRGLPAQQPADRLLVRAARRRHAGRQPRAARQAAAHRSMAPTLVFDRASGELVAALGSPGGSQIIGYVASTLVGMLDWDLDVQQAIAMPNFGSRNGPTEVETRTHRSPRRSRR